jgi:hypothetical protein
MVCLFFSKLLNLLGQIKSFHGIGSLSAEKFTLTYAAPAAKLAFYRVRTYTMKSTESGGLAGVEDRRAPRRVLPRLPSIEPNPGHYPPDIHVPRIKRAF